MNTITAQALHRQLREGRKLKLLDVRTPAEFSRCHAAGAQLIPLNSLNIANTADLRCSEADPLYVLCHSGALAAKACEQLTAMGVGPVFRVDGGTVAWEQAGLPITKSSSGTISLERQVRIAAGSLVLIGLILAMTIRPAFASLSAFVGAGLIFTGITDCFGMGMLLAKMPWYRAQNSSCAILSPKGV